MPEYVHEGLDARLILKDDLRQVHLERWFQAYRDEKGGEIQSDTEDRGAIVRAAFKAGWVEHPRGVDVGDLRPAVVRWMAKRINDLYVELTDIPPE